MISPLSISIFSTLIKLTSPFPDLSFGVVPFVISEHNVPNLRCSQECKKRNLIKLQKIVVYKNESAILISRRRHYLLNLMIGDLYE